MSKTCVRCHTEVDDGALICPTCASREFTGGPTAAAPQAAAETAPPANAAPGKSGGKRGAMWGGAALLVVLILAAGGWYLFVKLPEDIRREVAHALDTLPPPYKADYGEIDVSILKQEATVQDLTITSASPSPFAFSARVVTFEDRGTADTIPTFRMDEVRIPDPQNVEMTKAELTIARLRVKGLRGETWQALQSIEDLKKARSEDIGFDTVSVEQMELTGDTRDTLRLDHFSMHNAVGGYVEKMVLTGFSVTTEELLLSMESAEATDQPIARFSDEGRKISFVPERGSGPAVISGLKIGDQDRNVSIARLAMDAQTVALSPGGHKYPNHFGFQVEGMIVPVSKVKEARGLGLLEDFPDLRLDFSAAVTLDADTDSLTISDVVLDGRDLGRFSMRGGVSGFEVDPLMQNIALMQTEQDAMLYFLTRMADKLALAELRMEYEDKGLIDLFIAKTAEEKGYTPEKLREELLANLKFRSRLSDKPLERQFLEAFARLIEKPGRVVLSVRPTSEVLVIEVGDLLQDPTGSGIKTLGLTIDAEPI